MCRRLPACDHPTCINASVRGTMKRGKRVQYGYTSPVSIWSEKEILSSLEHQNPITMRPWQTIGTLVAAMCLVPAFEARSQYVEVYTDCPCNLKVEAWSNILGGFGSDINQGTPFIHDFQTADGELEQLLVTPWSDTSLHAVWDHNADPSEPFEDEVGPADCTYGSVLVNLQGGRAFVPPSAPPYHYVFKVTCKPQ